MPGYSWLLVQPEVANSTRACWFDRAGYGAGSDAAPAPQGSDAIATDLHQLLQAASVPPPYVLVGHSFGGFNVRVYYARYPGEVAGMVLVDPSHEDMGKIPDLANVGAPLLGLPSALFSVVRRIARTLGPFGVFRLLAPSPSVPPRGITPDQWATIASLRRQPKSQLVQEGSPAANFEIVRHGGDLGSLPLTVLAAGQPPRAQDPTADNVSAGLD